MLFIMVTDLRFEFTYVLEPMRRGSCKLRLGHDRAQA